MKISPNNDNGCGWLNLLPKRPSTPAFKGTKRAKWLIIGAGYSGLSAALTLAENLPSEEIILVDANKAGEGASARNSGFLVASALNEGHLSDNGLDDYKEKINLYKKSIELAKHLIQKHNIECDWQESGKYHASKGLQHKEKLKNYIELLDGIGINSQLLEGNDLSDKLGTDFYKIAAKTESCILLQPAAFARGLVNALPENVTLYENSVVKKINSGSVHKITFADGEIIADNLIVAVNGFMPSMKIKNNRVFPLLLSASMTRPLTVDEQSMIGNVNQWGVVSASAMGATVRYTSDKRIKIRNTVEVSSSLAMKNSEMAKRRKIHQEGLIKRFPFIKNDIFEHSWSGVTCISANNANVYQEISNNHWVIGCYNGTGIGMSTLFGQEIALRALGKSSKTNKIIEDRPKASWLPPQPFLNWGIRMRLAKDRNSASSEN